MKWEFRLLDYFRSHRTKALDVLMPFFSYIGNVGIVWILISVTLTLIPATRFCGVCVLGGAFLASAFANLVVKPFAKRLRPFERRPDVGMLVRWRPHGSSFPSGHSTTSFGGALGGTLGFAWVFGGWIAAVASVLLFLLAINIAFSRMYLYLHFPTDVFVGAVVGLCFGAGVPFGAAALFGWLSTVLPAFFTAVW